MNTLLSAEKSKSRIPQEIDFSTSEVCTDAIIEFQNLRVEYRAQQRCQSKKVAVRDLSLTIRSGELFGFLGPNGARKTTTMNVMRGSANPSAGAASLFAVNVLEPTAHQRIGYLPELTDQDKFLTAEELLRCYAKIFRIPNAQTNA